MSPSPGSNFGRYRIERLLGEGGMGAVYLATDTQLDRKIALKIPKFEPGDEEGRRRFLREARTAGGLQHPNICSVHDVGEIDGVPFLTMAYIDGHPLSESCRGGRRLPEPQAARCVAKLARALAVAHRAGVIHRDLKPANVMINTDGEPILMDFGLARSFQDSASTQLTQSGMILGSPAYMSPEQVQGKPDAIGPATDIYSLGVVLFELLAGRVPYDGPVTVVIAKILTKAAPPLRQFRPDLDERLEAICRKMMAKKISERYSSMSEVAAALEGETIADAVTVAGRRSLPQSQAAADSTKRVSTRKSGEPAKTPPPATQPIPKSPRRVAIVACGLAAAAIGLGWVVMASWPQNGLRSSENLHATTGVVNGTETSESNRAEKSPDPDKVQPSAVHPKSGSLTEGTNAGDEWTGNSLSMKLCWCPEGTFTMGSPTAEPQRLPHENQVQVSLAGFWMGKHEVTQSEWSRVMKTAPDELRAIAGASNVRIEEAPRLPVCFVSHGDATEFAKRLTEQEHVGKRLPLDWEFRLPTEAQWEYACRANTSTATAFGDSLGSLQANFQGDFPYQEAAKGPTVGKSTEVGSYPANPWGLCDMHGNLWEWCRDWYEIRLPGGRNPEVTQQSRSRVSRGGCYFYNGDSCRSANRISNAPDTRTPILGFRIAAVRKSD